MSPTRPQAPTPAKSPLATWFARRADLERFRRRRLGRTPLILAPRDEAWRTIAPDFATTVRMAAAGLPFQVAAERRYDRSGEPRRLRAALATGATIFLPQVHQVLPRLMRLMVALRVALLGPLRAECSFLFAVEGRGRPGMGLHHDGAVDAFWLQVEGRRTVTLGPPVRPGTPADLDAGTARSGPGWRTVDLTPGTLFHLPPWTPHDVVCHTRSLALSLTWRRPGARARRASLAARVAGLAAWDVVSGRVDALPRGSSGGLWTQVPAIVVSDGGRLRLVTPDGALALPPAAEPVARRLALMPCLPSAGGRTSVAFSLLLEHGIIAPHDLPLRIIPADPEELDGWRFA